MDRQIDMVIDRQTDGRKKINRWTKGQFAPQAGRQTYRSTDRQLNRQADVSMNTYRQTGRHKGGWTGR